MEDDLRILLLEDVIEEAVLIERVIKKEKIKYSSRRVDSRTQYTEALSSFRPHLILSDHALPQFNSIEALKLAREFDPIVPFILVTGTVSEEFAVACLKQGANDYILKSNLSRLPSSIRQALVQRETQENKKRAEHEVLIQNEKLVESNNELVKTNKELDNFVYSVSHNLRGPLTSILGIVNLSRLEKEAIHTELFGKIEELVKRLDETLREIIDYSRNTRYDVLREPVDMRLIFEQNFNRLKYLQGADRLKVVFTNSGNGIIYTDPNRINIIVHNIISNSIKYSDRSKHESFLHLDVTTTDSYVTLAFKDNGIGISSEVLPKVFTMFYRGSERSDGAGLGLYIAKEAVEKLRGFVDIKSAVGVGTEITIKIPCR
jgi:signal transduction histidine kinase